jgi:hypothetical protein
MKILTHPRQIHEIYWILVIILILKNKSYKSMHCNCEKTIFAINLLILLAIIILRWELLLPENCFCYFLPPLYR